MLEISETTTELAFINCDSHSWEDVGNYLCRLTNLQHLRFVSCGIGCAISVVLAVGCRELRSLTFGTSTTELRIMQPILESSRGICT